MQRDKKPSLEKLWKGYVGFLEGTGKSRSTISSYERDLAVFRDYLKEKQFDFYQMKQEDFSGYLAHLEKLGMKMNTRRRKILTVRALYRYALTRKKITLSPAQFVAAPPRLERLPWIPKVKDVEDILANLPKETLTALRDRVLVSLLAETGLGVAELCLLTWEQVSGRKIDVKGKRPRTLTVSASAAKALQEWRKKSKGGKFLFPGFNRHGITTAKMTPRGVELVFRALAKRSGYPKLKPKTLRHHAIVSWLQANVNDQEMQRRLGVGQAYGFHAYREYLRG